MTKKDFVKIMNRTIRHFKTKDSWSCNEIGRNFHRFVGQRHLSFSQLNIVKDYGETFGVGCFKFLNNRKHRLAALLLYKEMALDDKRYLNF